MRFLHKVPLLKRFAKDVPLVPVVRMAGVIGESGRFGDALNLMAVAPHLEKAFGMKAAKAVAILINSPGGSPVQSGLIFSRIRQLAEKNEKPVLIFVEDVAASGGYLIACAGDEIFVHDASIVGSIGVISAGFGFTGLLDKVGVERRVYTAGESKSMLDPFQPEKEDDIERLKALQGDIHAYFKDIVRTSRQDKLKAPRKQLFSGDIWVGDKAVKAGLVDGVGMIRPVLMERFGEDVITPLVSGRKRLRLPFMPRLEGGGLISARDISTQMRTETLWARYGL